MSEITKIDENGSNSLPRWVWYGLAALTVFVYLYGLSIPLVGPDEARYAQVAREMWQAGDWITPTLGGHPWFEKPPLLYWLVMASFEVFGPIEFAARLGPALFGLGTVASLWLLARSVSDPARATNNEQRTTNDFANYLALIAATTLGIVIFSRGASFDIIITFPLTAAMVSFFIFDQSENSGARVNRYLALVSLYTFIGLALLAKGLIGILFPFAIIALYFALSRRLPGRTFLVSIVWGTLLAMAIASLWYLPMYYTHGYRFVDEFFIQHHFQRFTSNKYQHPQPFYFFLWVLPLMTLPWAPFFFAALVRSVKEGFNRRDAETQSQRETNGGVFAQGTVAAPPLPDSPTPPLLYSPTPLLRFSVAWLAVPLIFFSFSGSKLPGYILPAVPAAMILTTVIVYGLLESSRKWRTVVLSIAVATLLGAIVLLTFAVPRFAETDSVKSLFAAADARGYAESRVLMLHTLSHNAEFYAPGRLVRDADGRQRRLSTISEVLDELEAGGGRPVLVMIPREYVSQVTNTPSIRSEVLENNGELALVAVSPR